MKNNYKSILTSKLVTSPGAGLWCGHGIVYPFYLTGLGCSG